jgi:hypothetical protein
MIMHEIVELIELTLYSILPSRQTLQHLSDLVTLWQSRIYIVGPGMTSAGPNVDATESVLPNQFSFDSL